MTAPRERDCSTMVAACYGVMTVVQVAGAAVALVLRQNGSLEAMWWELTQSDATASYAQIGGAALLNLVMTALSFRFTRRPRAARVIAVTGGLLIFVTSLVVPLLSVLTATGFYRPGSHDLKVQLEFSSLPFVLVPKLILALIYCFCAYELIRLSRTSNYRLERP